MIEMLVGSLKETLQGICNLRKAYRTNLIHLETIK